MNCRTGTSRGVLGLDGIVVGAAVDLANSGCVVGMIALWTAWADLLAADTLLRMRWEPQNNLGGLRR